MFFLSFISIPSSGMIGRNDRLEAAVQYTSMSTLYFHACCTHLLFD